MFIKSIWALYHKKSIEEATLRSFLEWLLFLQNYV